MNIALLLNQQDAEQFMSRHPMKGIRIIADGVDTFTYLERQHIPYQRLSRFMDLKRTKAELAKAFSISEQFVNQPAVSKILKQKIDYRFPIHQALKYFLLDIVRSKNIVERILNIYHPTVIYASDTLYEPLLQKTHNQEFSLLRQVLIGRAKQRNISITLLIFQRYHHYLELKTLFVKNIVEAIINGIRSVTYTRSSIRDSKKTTPTVLISASLHMLINMIPLIHRFKKKWAFVPVGKLSVSQQQTFKKANMSFINLNTINRSLSLSDFSSSIFLTTHVFLRFLFLPKKIKEKFFERKLNISLWQMIGPYLAYCTSVFINELTKNYRFISRHYRQQPFNFILASNNMDPFNTALMFFAKRKNIPYTLMIHDAQGNTFCDFFFEETDTLFVWGNFQKRIMEKDFPRLNCVVTGHPDFDSYIYKAKKGNSTRKSLMDKKEISILILSAYNPFIQFPNQEILFDVFRELNQLKTRNIRVTLKSHPSENHSQLVTLTQPMVNYPLRWSQKDTNQLINQHDIIIAQSTSAGIRTILVHKPLIYLNIHDFRDYEPYATSKAALGVYSLDELIPAINSFISNPNMLTKYQDSFIQDFCYKLDGKSSQRIMEYISAKISCC
ncbi:CDP-glycerol glycerophosphotransferase family protein [Candidatus Collierbacteria bacterium]|nr:CDP-glycerol glycerophosphotransferase family protein [Candidatus Collierbacteria bacterium]